MMIATANLSQVSITYNGVTKMFKSNFPLDNLFQGPLVRMYWEYVLKYCFTKMSKIHESFRQVNVKVYLSRVILLMSCTIGRPLLIVTPCIYMACYKVGALYNRT